MSEPADNVVRLQPEAEIVKGLRDELGPLLKQVAAVMDRGKQNGLTVSFQIALDSYGRYYVPKIAVLREL
jgi:hypothetical protein